MALSRQSLNSSAFAKASSTSTVTTTSSSVWTSTTMTAVALMYRSHGTSRERKWGDKGNRVWLLYCILLWWWGSSCLFLLWSARLLSSVLMCIPIHCSNVHIMCILIHLHHHHHHKHQQEQEQEQACITVILNNMMENHAKTRSTTATPARF